MCLAGTVVASWYPTQELAGFNRNVLVTEFNENIQGKFKYFFVIVTPQRLNAF